MLIGVLSASMLKLYHDLSDATVSYTIPVHETYDHKSSEMGILTRTASKISLYRVYPYLHMEMHLQMTLSRTYTKNVYLSGVQCSLRFYNIKTIITQ